ncbi:MAG: aminotransferase class IV [Bacteroidota bacterium]|nr:aminotransferase class IV [Bacteroidota bacterium]
MCLLFESIKISQNKICLPEFHESRMNNSRLRLFNTKEKINFIDKIEIPEYLDYEKIYKLRITYRKEIESVIFTEYHKRATNSLRIVISNDIDYSYKYNNRDTIIRLQLGKGDADDILIVKNNFVTDTSYANIVFYDGTGWVTPSAPLLPGTKRAYLIKKGLLTEKEITLQDIHTFEKACLINAFLDIEKCNEVEIYSV